MSSEDISILTLPSTEAFLKPNEGSKLKTSEAKSEKRVEPSSKKVSPKKEIFLYNPKPYIQTFVVENKYWSIPAKQSIKVDSSFLLGTDIEKALKEGKLVEK